MISCETLSVQIDRIVEQKYRIEQKTGMEISIGDSRIYNILEKQILLEKGTGTGRISLEQMLGILEQIGDFKIQRGGEEGYFDQILLPLTELELLESEQCREYPKLTAIEMKLLLQRIQKVLDTRQNHREELLRQADNINESGYKGTAIAEDGTQIEYAVYGRKGAPVLVLVTAFGIPMDIWKYLIAAYQERYCVILWKLRETTAQVMVDKISLEKEMQDLEAVLDKERVQSAIFFCWCSGLKCFELFHKKHSDVVKALVVISGYFNPMKDTGSYWSEFDRTIGSLSRMIEKDKRLLQSNYVCELIKKLFSFRLDKNTGSANTDGVADLENKLKSAAEDVRELITYPFMNTDRLAAYAKITVQLQEMDMSSELDKIKCPTLILNAGMDKITEIQCAKAAYERIPVANYVELPYASHWSIWEDYEEVSYWIDIFLDVPNRKG